jgi:hypothetical protein
MCSMKYIYNILELKKLAILKETGNNILNRSSVYNLFKISVQREMTFIHLDSIDKI